MNALSFGVRGLSHAERMIRIAQADLAEARLCARTVRSTVLMHYWSEVAAQARREIAAWEMVAHVGRNANGLGEST